MKSKKKSQKLVARQKMTRPRKTLCVNRGRSPVPTAHVKKLCEKLFLFFKRNKTVRRFQSTDSHTDDLSVVFVGSAESRRLNRIYRRKDYATDVLSFSSDEIGQGLGELVLCLAVLRRQAREQGHSLKKELDTLVIHGFLHLLGFDHEKSRKEELKMMKLQDKLITKFSKT